MHAEQHHHSLAVTGDYINSDIISQMMSFKAAPSQPTNEHPFDPSLPYVKRNGA